MIQGHQKFQKSNCSIFRCSRLHNRASIFGHLSSLSKPLSFVYILKSCWASQAPLAKQKSLGGNTLSIVKKDNLQIHTLNLQIWFLQSSANSNNEWHSTSLSILMAAFKSQNAQKRIWFHWQELRTAESEDISEIFSKRFLLNSQTANLRLHLH